MDSTAAGKSRRLSDENPIDIFKSCWIEIRVEMITTTVGRTVLSSVGPMSAVV